MDVINYLFPFEFIDRNSKVVIYGLGKCGKEYISQIEETTWCEIVGVCDKYKKSHPYRYPSVSVEELRDSDDYDYVIVAITSNGIWEEACEYLKNNGIKKEKIISKFELTSSRPGMRSIITGQDDCKSESRKDNHPLEILFIMRGGIGDGVMETALYAELIRMVPDMIIDVYGEPYFSFLYSPKANVRKVYNYHVDSIQYSDYDLVLEGSWGISISHCDLKRIHSHSQELYDTVMRTIEAMKNNALVNRVCMARLKGKNKFWLMSREGVWNISPKNIHVDLVEEYKEEFEKLGLKKYITFNCGADMRRINEPGEFPTKVWPVEYFERLSQMISNKFPDYEVIQLGSKNATKVEAASRHFLGLSMDVVEYIVANSTLHIDDEGGLVHLATAFGTKCIVLFGPTPRDLLGYPQNINLCTDVCRGCFPLGKWNATCALGMKRPKCMYSLTPELVMEEVATYIMSIKKGTQVEKI